MDMNSAKKSCFVRVLNTITHVIKYEDSTLKDPDVIILVIPGNPGVITFYEVFMEELFSRGKKQIPVWGLSHAGHHHKCASADPSRKPEDENQIDVYGLRGQIEHKTSFVQKYIPSNTKLILIGHSIGCYMILKMMDELPEMKVIKSYLLFPTIEKMLVSPNGMILGPILMYFRWLALLPIFLASYLDENIQRRLIQWHFRHRDIPSCAVRGVLNLFNTSVSANALYMAAQEMRQVTERDNSLVERHISKICFYYGTTDKWCPISYYEDMKQTFPDGSIRLCEEGIEHAFCLMSSSKMVQVMWPWILNDLKKKDDGKEEDEED